MHYPQPEHAELARVLKPGTWQQQPARPAHQPAVRQRDRQRAELAKPDRFAEIKADYVKNGPGRSNLRYGWVSNAV